MSEEEKEAIDTLKRVIDEDTGVISDDIQDDEIEIILNLIDKQQQEIEELRKINNKYNDMKYFAMVADRYISKDKIKEKIEFYKRYGKIKNSDEYVMSVEIEVLEELLGD